MPFPFSGIIFIWLSTNLLISIPETNFLFLSGNNHHIQPVEKKWYPRQEVAKKAEFPGGRKALKDYMDTNLNIPAIAFERNGNKEVVFGAEIIIRIAEDGSVGLIKYHKLHIQPQEPEVIQAIQEELNKFVGQMPRWAPATKSGKPVAALDTISFIESYAPDVNFAEYQQLKKIPHSNDPKNTFFSSSELRTKDGKQVFQFVQSPPAFPGGDKALKEYLIQNLSYLHQNQQKGELVGLNLIINEKGEAEDIKVIKPNNITLNPEEVKIVLQKMPLWKPGKQNNKPIPVSYTVPIRF